MAGKPRRKRSDSAAFQSAIMQDALKGKEPPHYVKITKEERPFWDAIIAARTDWTEIDLVHAAAMARCQHAIEHQSLLMSKEGVVIKTRTTVKLNPRLMALSSLMRMSLEYSVKIQVHARATIGPEDEQVLRNKQKKLAIDSVQSNFEDMEDGLIARPKQ